jgi:hypothetical protein
MIQMLRGTDTFYIPDAAVHKSGIAKRLPGDHRPS